jgi:glycosyltransferase involved in cell wall biosynthesis
MSQPRFSVIMPLYNHAPFVGAAVESVLAQSFDDFELIVCDDGSTDESLNVVRRFKDERMRLITKPNGGTVSALNACLLKACGEYVCWLSSDDLYARDKLKSHDEYHSIHAASAFSVAPFGYLDGTRFVPGGQVRVAAHLRLLHFVFGNYINGLSVCAHRQLYAINGLFDPRYRYAHDVERWFSFMRFENPGFIEGPPQSFTRMSSGHVADGDLLGHLDVLKFLSHVLQTQGLKGLTSREAPVVTGAGLLEFFERLFRTENLFYRFHMRVQLIDWVSRSLADEAGQLMLFEARDLLGARGGNVPTELRHAVDEVCKMAVMPAARQPPSFVEHAALLKGSLSSEQQRAVFDRFLRVGF